MKRRITTASDGTRDLGVLILGLQEAIDQAAEEATARAKAARRKARRLTPEQEAECRALAARLNRAAAHRQGSPHGSLLARSRATLARARAWFLAAKGRGDA